MQTTQKEKTPFCLIKKLNVSGAIVMASLTMLLLLTLIIQLVYEIRYRANNLVEYSSTAIASGKAGIAFGVLLALSWALPFTTSIFMFLNVHNAKQLSNKTIYLLAGLMIPFSFIVSFVALPFLAKEPDYVATEQEQTNEQVDTSEPSTELTNEEHQTQNPVETTTTSENDEIIKTRIEKINALRKANLIDDNEYQRLKEKIILDK